MTNTYYECHLTIEGDRELARDAVMLTGWKFSSIDGDIVTGPGVRHYATRHYKSSLPVEHVLERLHLCGDYIAERGVSVVRRKVEHVIYDDRSVKIAPCSGGCAECHLDDRDPEEISEELFRRLRAPFYSSAVALVIGLVIGQLL